MLYVNLPETKHWRFDDPPPGERVEFRLVYKGVLHAETASQSRAREKHELRKAFHKQLKELWKSHPVLRKQQEKRVSFVGEPPQITLVPPGREELYQNATVWVEHVADTYKRRGYRFSLLRGRKMNLFVR